MVKEIQKHQAQLHEHHDLTSFNTRATNRTTRSHGKNVFLPHRVVDYDWNFYWLVSNGPSQYTWQTSSRRKEVYTTIKLWGNRYSKPFLTKETSATNEISWVSLW